MASSSFVNHVFERAPRKLSDSSILSCLLYIKHPDTKTLRKPYMTVILKIYSNGDLDCSEVCDFNHFVFSFFSSSCFFNLSGVKLT